MLRITFLFSGAEDGESESEESDEDSDLEDEENCNSDEELRSRLRAALGNAAADEEDSVCSLCFISLQ